MIADIANKQTDTLFKAEQVRWEPWKVVIGAIAASAAVFGGLGGLVGATLGYLIARHH